MTVNDLIGTLNQLPSEQPIAYVLWQPADVKAEAESVVVKLTEQEIKDVLFDMQDNTDCEYGMTWTSVRCSIEKTLENNKK